MGKNYDHQILENNISYWKFKEQASEKDYENAYEEYVNAIRKNNISKLMVTIEQKNKWDATIENLWKKTGELAEQNGIKKWGVVIPDSYVWEMTMERVLRGGRYDNNPVYDIKVGREEKEIFDWIKNS